MQGLSWWKERWSCTCCRVCLDYLRSCEYGDVGEPYVVEHRHFLPSPREPRVDNENAQCVETGREIILPAMGPLGRVSLSNPRYLYRMPLLSVEEDTHLRKSWKVLVELDAEKLATARWKGRYDASSRLEHRAEDFHFVYSVALVCC